jgi:hypothetical protein
LPGLDRLLLSVMTWRIKSTKENLGIRTIRIESTKRNSQNRTKEKKLKNGINEKKFLE